MSEADFTLTLSADKALVIQGRTQTVVATVTRRAGFDGAVNVALSDLPAGVSASPVVIASGANSATITLLAQPSAPHSLPTSAKAAGSAGNQNSQNVSKPLTVTVGGLPGMVDTSFNGGAQLTSVGEGEDYAFAMAVQADGKVVTVGRTATNAGGTDIAITRHLRDGTLDPSFGSGGKVITAVAPGRAADEGRAVLIQPDGKIVVGGYTDATGTDKDFLIVRYNADGSLDSGFGTGGRTITPIGNSTDQVHALVRQADGKIVAGGSATFTQTTGQDFALVRYNANGSLDGSFGSGGKVTTPIGSAGDLIYSVATQSIAGQERIVAVGGEGTFMAARYMPNGTLDTSFGNNGKVATLFTSVIGAARSVIVGADNKLVISGHIGHEFSMVQLHADGSLDTSFGSGGKVTTAVSTTNWDEATAVVRQADGKLLVGGWVYDGVSTNGDFVVLRYNVDGSADTGFGSFGRVITGVAPNSRSDSGRALALQVDERVDTVRVLQAGEASDSGNKFALLRYWL
ncbi:MAG: hypothetical protein H7Z19_04330 [Chitinophagaceae bacterium]|nr:hypothetical protein [Rubrivivax sp.]